MNISNACRSCMKEVASWEKGNLEISAVEMFYFCTNIKINLTLEDNLPKQFCYSCRTKIESSYTFIKEAQKIDLTLNNMISRNITVIVQPDNYKHENNYLKLTLPEYKISTTINNDEKCLNTDYGQCNENDYNEKNEEIQEEAIQEEKCIEELENGKKKNVCPVCQKSFVSKIWFSRHVEKEYSCRFRCSQCPKTFLKSSQLSNHLACHSVERRFVCNTCEKTFKWRKQLTMHTRTHADIRPYACEKCDKRFKYKSVLKNHMKVHEDEKQYLCSFCGWSFAQAGNLEMHIRKHTGDKPFKCAQCPFRASLACNLRRHERMHNGAKTHTCHHCRKGFYDAGSLARHTRTHTGELPYKCPGCERAFADSWKRKTHLMRTHRMRLQDIPRMTRDGQT